MGGHGGECCQRSCQRLHSDEMGGRCFLSGGSPGAPRDAPGHLRGPLRQRPKDSSLGPATCLPFLQETLGLIRTHGLMPPKFVLHILVPEGFEVRGQKAVQLQDAPIQSPDAGHLPARHTAARGERSAPAQRNGAVSSAPPRPSLGEGQPEVGRKRRGDLLPVTEPQDRKQCCSFRERGVAFSRLRLDCSSCDVQSAENLSELSSLGFVLSLTVFCYPHRDRASPGNCP